MSELSDNALFARISTGRDRDAFAELCRRYQNDLFRLARYMTGSQQAAEDAVQETLFRVWRSPEKFHGGNVRNWMLRIAAHECLHVLRAHAAKRRREVEIGHSKIGSAASNATNEQAELHEALRQTLTQLPDEERQMLALYFGANFTQEEIGNAMGFSQRTISERIEQVLSKLRVRLAQAGFASMAAFSSADFLKAVETAPAPPAFIAQVVGRLEFLPAAAHAAKAAALSKATWAVVAGCTIAGITAAALMLPSWRAPAPPAPSPAPVLSQPLSTINRLWDFKTGPADDLQVVQGAWQWQKADEGGDMLIPRVGQRQALTTAEVLLPQRFPSGVPFEIVLKATTNPKSFRNGVLAQWAAAHEVLPAKFWFTEHEISRADHALRIAVSGKHTVSYRNEHVLGALEFNRGWPGERMVLLISGWVIHAIEVREVPFAKRAAFEAEVLKGFRDLQTDPKVNSKDRHGYELDP